MRYPHRSSLISRYRYLYMYGITISHPSMSMAASEVKAWRVSALSFVWPRGFLVLAEMVDGGDEAGLEFAESDAAWRPG